MTGQTIKSLIKSALFKSGIDLTRNQQYDRQARKVMERVLKKDSNCIDVGCHKGEMLEIMLRFAPQGKHLAFEPLPDLYKTIGTLFKNYNCTVYPLALSNTSGTTSFNYVKNAPAYSGIKSRKYAVKKAEIETITVQTDCLDNIVPADMPVHFIKIDVEGGEFNVMKGAENTLKKNKPVIIFECGIGAADYYGTQPEDVFDYITGCGLRVSLMKDWLLNKPSLSKQAFCEHYFKKRNYYFMAHR